MPRPAVGRRGRGATPLRRFTVEIPEPNPAGRRKLTFEFRAASAWSEELVGQVCELLEVYFGALGGFRLARDPLVRAWYRALASGLYTAAELRLAILAKAASLAWPTRHGGLRGRAYIAHPGHFLRSAGYWLSLTPDFQARLRAARERSAAALHERLAAAVYGQGSRPAAPVGDAVAVWPTLSRVQRAIALYATRRAFMESCARWGVDPASADLAALRIDYAVAWAAVKWPAGGMASPATDGSLRSSRTKNVPGLFGVCAGVSSATDRAFLEVRRLRFDACSNAR